MTSVDCVKVNKSLKIYKYFGLFKAVNHIHSATESHKNASTTTKYLGMS